MDFRPHVTKGVVAVLSIVALTFSQTPSAEDSDGASASSETRGTDQGSHEATLIANLAEYGEKNQNALALLAAASMINGMDAGVARRDGTHKQNVKDHGADGLYTVEALLALAKKIAANLDEDSARDVLNTAERLSKRERNYLGYLHTHYVWWCDNWGYCGYRYVSHY